MMKSRTRLTANNASKPLHVDSKAKIYVPISVNNQNHNSGGTSQQQQINHQNNVATENAIVELRRANMEFK